MCRGNPVKTRLQAGWFQLTDVLIQFQRTFLVELCAILNLKRWFYQFGGIWVVIIIKNYVLQKVCICLQNKLSCPPISKPSIL